MHLLSIGGALVAWWLAFPTESHPTVPAGPLGLLVGFAQAMHELGKVLLLFVVLGYGLITSIAMFWLQRWPLAPLVLHGAVFSAFALHTMSEQRAEQEREEAFRQTPEYARQQLEVALGECLQASLEVTGAPKLKATVSIHNRGCPFDLVVDQVDCVGFFEDGNAIMQDPTYSRESVVIGPNQFHGFAVEDSLHPPVDTAVWTFKSNVILRGPVDRMICVATPGARASERCRPFADVRK